MSKWAHAEGISLHVKIMLFMSVIILFAIGVITFVHVTNFRKNYLEAITWRSETLAQSISYDIRSRYNLFGKTADPRLMLEAAYLQCKKLYDANKDMHVAFIGVLDGNGEIVTHNDKSFWGTRIDSPEFDRAFSLHRITTVLVGGDYHTLIPVFGGDHVLLGMIDVGFPREVVDHKIMEGIYYSAWLFVVLFLMAFFLAWLFTRRLVTYPISQLIEATADIANGNLYRNIQVNRTREFRRLAEGLMHLRDSVRQSIHDVEQKNSEVKALMACSPVALFSVDLEERVAIWPKSAVNMFGWNDSEVLGKTLPTVPDDQRQAFDALCASVREGKVIPGRELRQQRKDGSIFYASLSSAPIRDRHGGIIGIMGAVQDISERIAQEEAHRDMQQQLVQAQKMESIGRLAGGVAHDYNNMLTVILGYSELVLEDMDPDDSHYKSIQEIIKATKRSAQMTRQLLAFARKQTIVPEIVNLNTCVESTLKMLRPLLGENYELEWLPKDNLPSVKMDVSQIDSVLVNLCINARDAMEHGGMITIATKTAAVDSGYCGTHAGFQPGDFVCLVVSDEGVGMDKQMQAKIFEPFFTTKARGKGTGLGLATVYGIVKQNNGFINVYSEPGRGAIFSIYIPQYSGETGTTEPRSMETMYMGHGETVLVVEDEEGILTMCRQLLENLGYNVLHAQTPSAAIELAKTSRANIRLLVTDVILQEINGRELSEKIKEICPDMNTLYMSGYTADVIAHHGVIEEGVQFIQKPFSKTELAAKVWEAMDNQHPLN